MPLWPPNGIYWLLRARWTAVIDRHNRQLQYAPQPKWTQHARSFWRPEIILEAMECRRLAINLTIRISVRPPLVKPNVNFKTTGLSGQGWSEVMLQLLMNSHQSSSATFHSQGNYFRRHNKTSLIPRLLPYRRGRAWVRGYNKTTVLHV